MPTTRTPDHDPEYETPVRPRYLAGPGDLVAVEDAFEPLRGWRVSALTGGPVIATSPCQRIRIGYQPGQQHAWQVSATPDLFGVPAWRGSFSANTPPEILAGYFGALADSLQYDVATDSTGTFVSLEGTLDDACEPLTEAGWIRQYDGPDGRSRTTTGDGEAEYEVAALLDPAVELASVPSRFTWRVSPPEPELAWSAAFSSCTPLHLVAAVNGTLTADTPAVRPTDALPRRVVTRSTAEQERQERRAAQEAIPPLPAATELLAQDAGLLEPLVAVSPLYLAGAGPTERAVQALTSAAGWTVTSGEAARVWESPCQTVRVAHFGPGRYASAWHITGLSAPVGMPLWRATLGRETPAEVVSAVTALVAETVAARSPDALHDVGKDLPLPLNLTDHGWTASTAHMITTLTSPDPKVRLHLDTADFGHQEEMAGIAPVSWTLTAMADDRFPAWTATFTHYTPPYLITAAAQSALDPAPASRTRLVLPRLHQPYVQVFSTGRVGAALSGTARAGAPTTAPPPPAAASAPPDRSRRR